MQYKYAEIGDVVYFWFAANDTTGTAGDGATPEYHVRLAGAAADAAPIASGTPTLLTHADYAGGSHEAAVDTTGYAAGEYAVFCELTISTVNPNGFVGSVKLRTAGTGALNVNAVSLTGHTAQTGDAYAVVANGTYGNSALKTILDTVKLKTDNLPSSVPKGVALSNFTFVMFSSRDHITPATGLSVEGKISKDGGAFVSIDGTVSALAYGFYVVDSLTATEMDADIISLRFTAMGADAAFYTIKTDT